MKIFAFIFIILKNLITNIFCDELTYNLKDGQNTSLDIIKPENIYYFNIPVNYGELLELILLIPSNLKEYKENFFSTKQIIEIPDDKAKIYTTVNFYQERVNSKYVFSFIYEIKTISTKSISFELQCINDLNDISLITNQIQKPDKENYYLKPGKELTLDLNSFYYYSFFIPASNKDEYVEFELAFNYLELFNEIYPNQTVYIYECKTYSKNSCGGPVKIILNNTYNNEINILKGFYGVKQDNTQFLRIYFLPIRNFRNTSIVAKVNIKSIFDRDMIFFIIDLILVLIFMVMLSIYLGKKQIIKNNVVFIDNAQNKKLDNIQTEENISAIKKERNSEIKNELNNKIQDTKEPLLEIDDVY